jgi:hypothetical protein
MKTPPLLKLVRGLSAAGLLAFAGIAAAAEITVTPSSSTVTVGQTFTVDLGFVPDGATTNFNFRLNFTTTFADGTATTGTGIPNSCQGDPPPISDALGRVSITTTSGTGNPLTYTGLFCTVTFEATAEGAVELTISNENFSDSAGPHTLGSATVTVQAAPTPTGPLITAGSPAFGSTTAVSGGSIAGPAVTQNISFGASTGGAAGGTTDLVCTDDDANTTLSNATQNGITEGQTPATMVASFTPGAARTVTVSCTATRQNAAAQNFSYTFEVAEASPVTGPTLSPPAQTTYNVAGSVGGYGQASIQFTASGGDAGQSTALSCSAVAPVEIVSGGSQTVFTGSQPAPVVVRILLTDAPQSGTVTCNGVIFTINAAAGTTFMRPEIIPSASTWSKLALFGLLGVFGLLAVGFRRQG